MVALAVGIALVVVAVVMCLPGIFGWWPDVLAFLRGSIPVLAVLIGAVAILIGVADIKDKKEAEKEELEEKKNEEKEEKEGQKS
jgi:small neutral amino acid transporter SnatA (MarC family)